MSKIWRIVSVMAVANVLALGGLVAWLFMSDRMDLDRLRALRTMLTETLTEEEARLAAEATDAEAMAAQRAEEEKLAQPPLTASERFAMRLERTAMDQQRLDRLQREVDDLRRSLLIERDALAREREAFNAERSAFETARERLVALEGSEQFRKSLSVLEGLRAPQAKTVLGEMIAGRAPVIAMDRGADAAPAPVSDAELGLEQAVAYLDAMQDRIRTKVMAEFVKEDPVLASRLLERLRTQGLTAQAGGEPDE